MSNKNFTQQFNLTDLAQNIKTSVFTDLHCMMLAYFDRVVQAYDYNLNYGIISVRPIPLQSGQAEYNIYAYVITNEEYTTNDILMIGFTDSDFSKNLNIPNKVQSETDSTELHSLSYAVVINAHYAPRILDTAPTESTTGYLGEIVYVVEGE